MKSTLIFVVFVVVGGSLVSSSSNYLLDPLRRMGIDGEGTDRSVLSMDEVSLRQFWNSSWPSMVKQQMDALRAIGGVGGADGLSGLAFNMSSECRVDLIRLIEAVFRGETWAIQMADASGKFPSGLLLGNVQWIGSYAECVGASSNRSFHSAAGNVSTSIEGNYCLMSIGADSAPTSESMVNFKGIELHLGICLPRTCSSADAKALVDILLIGFTSTIHATEAGCTDNSTIPLDAGACVFIAILCIFGILLLLGTCLDVVSSQRVSKVVNRSADDPSDQEDDDRLIDNDLAIDHSEVIIQNLETRGRLYKFLVAFSVVSNAKKILSTEASVINRPLQALHGIRFLSMTWVILGHTYLFALMGTSNPIVFLDYLKRFTFQTVMNATVSVDTFFLLGGTLVAYLLLKEMRDSEGPRNIRWVKFFFHRFWRLTPLYMMVLAFFTTLLKYFGSGPHWSRTSDANCQANWWTNLLYINNIARSDAQCIGWSWYLSNDMQFFLLSPLFIILLYKWALIGFIVVSIFMLASFITIGVITSVDNLPASIPGMMQNITLQNQWFHDVYITPWCRINSYLVGIILGYILYKTNCRLRLPLGVVVLCWLLASVCNLSVLYGLWNVAKGSHLSSSVNALYACLHRTVWCIGVAWVILACATGNGGFVNDLLSMPIMFPLSRLTYAAYLVHPIVLIWYFFSQKVPLYVDDITMVYLFIANLVFSYVSAFVVSIICEAPLINLEKFFLRDHKSLENKA